ncbi:MAG: O-acetyl-ADP-ribose deacetylase [Bacteroidales bacterium]|nr:O-acetyl-ADP-ribose deacetylase [Bacteroidales bacterium]
MSAIELIQSDITQLEVDVIVNAANSTLRGGGGVDGAIHRAAGPRLLAECIKLNGCPTGEAKITDGFNLKARFVIHTVGPIWYGGDSHESDQLASCYRKSLSLAVENNCTSIAFPNISTGVYDFPKELAANIAIREVQTFLVTNKSISKVLFCCFDSENYFIYQRLLDKL